MILSEHNPIVHLPLISNTLTASVIKYQFLEKLVSSWEPLKGTDQPPYTLLLVLSGTYVQQKYSKINLR